MAILTNMDEFDLKLDIQGIEYKVLEIITDNVNEISPKKYEVNFDGFDEDLIIKIAWVDKITSFFHHGLGGGKYYNNLSEIDCESNTVTIPMIYGQEFVYFDKLWFTNYKTSDSLGEGLMSYYFLIIYKDNNITIYILKHNDGSIIYDNSLSDIEDDLDEKY